MDGNMAALKLRVLLASALAAWVALSPAHPALAQVTFHFDDPRGGNLVEFQSKAPLETFEGKTSQLTGSITLDPADISSMSGQLVVDLASFDTGLGLRNTHMREQVLHTNEYPRAQLVISSVRHEGPAALHDGQPLRVKLGADLTLHGQTRPVVVDVVATLRQASAETAKRGPGDLLEVQARFAVKLSEFGMERPKMLVMKVADEIKLSVKATATSAPRAGETATPGN